MSACLRLRAALFAVLLLALPAGMSARAAAPLRLPVSGAILLGVTWTSGTPEVEVRRHRASGWGPWESLEPDVAAEPGSAEAARVRPGTEPLWIGSGVDLVEARVVAGSGSARGLRLELVRDPGPAPSARGAPASLARPRLGTVVTRAGWGADERLRSGRPEYARAVQAVVLHHTVTANDYTQAEAAGYVRAVYAYHTRSRGYDDVGYNLLVDRFGAVYEGRAGGVDRSVVGAHTAGFNTGTLGVALLGNFDVTAAPAAMLDRVAGAAAWAADTGRFDPRATVTLTSKGSSRFPRGTRATVRRLAGHRDLGSTACPGRHAYAELPALRDDAWHRLAATFSGVAVTGAPLRPPHPVTLSARLDHAADWTVTVVGPMGMVTAKASGRGTSVGLSWDGTITAGLPAPPGDYAFTMTADDGVHGPSDPVSGTFAVTPP